MNAEPTTNQDNLPTEPTHRWAGFVEDPAESVRDADRLIDEVAAALLGAFQARPE